MDRVIGRYGNPESDTLIIFVGGIHGNEPGGVHALEDVFQVLEQRETALSDAFIVGLRGNISALKAQKRYIHQDLNRLWSQDYMDFLRVGDTDVEDLKELKELVDYINGLDWKKYSKRYFIDLHATSAKNGIFIVTPDHERTSALTDSLEAPVVLGLEKKLANTALAHMHNEGFLSFGFEAGQLLQDSTRVNHTYAVWSILYALDIVERVEVPEFYLTYRGMADAVAEIPSVLDVDAVYSIKFDEQFNMKAGFSNFDWVNKDEVLATNQDGDILAPNSGYILMPLYQKDGKDGFFMVHCVDKLSRHRDLADPTVTKKLCTNCDCKLSDKELFHDALEI